MEKTYTSWLSVVWNRPSSGVVCRLIWIQASLVFLRFLISLRTKGHLLLKGEETTVTPSLASSFSSKSRISTGTAYAGDSCAWDSCRCHRTLFGRCSGLTGCFARQNSIVCLGTFEDN